MLSFVEIVPASASLLPPACLQCDWFLSRQGTSGAGAAQARAEWMDQVMSRWGSVGLAAVEGRETLAVIQFAPVATLPRPAFLAPQAPSTSTLLFCLRYRLDKADGVSRLLLHRALALLRERRVPEVHAYATRLGEAAASGNLMGLEFLQANGFHLVREQAGVYLMRIELKGLIPALSDFAWKLRRLPAAPTPVGG